MKLKPNKKEPPSFKLNGIPLPDQAAVHFASVGSFPYKTAYPSDSITKEKEATKKLSEVSPVRTISLHNPSPVVIPTATKRSEDSEQAPLKME